MDKSRPAMAITKGLLNIEKIFPCHQRMNHRGSPKKKQWSVQKGPSSKAAAAWTSGAYEGVREHGQGATCLREAAPAKAGNTPGGLFQHFHKRKLSQQAHNCFILKQWL
ncbi:MAG TPA: hypothetical protein PKK23_10355 [Nitrospirales bacterium]|nr:hypothetical protein [Nitrospirales bacterium]